MPRYTVLCGHLCTANIISERGPAGAGGHRVFFPLATLAAALPTLEKIPLRYHKQVIGFTEYGIFSHTWHPWNDDLLIRARLDLTSGPEAIAEVRKQAKILACAYEIAEVEVKDMYADVWEITKCVFTGVSLKPEEEIA